MSTFIVEGGHSLHGSISPQGAKERGTRSNLCHIAYP